MIKYKIEPRHQIIFKLQSTDIHINHITDRFCLNCNMCSNKASEIKQQIGKKCFFLYYKNNYRAA